MFKAGKWCKQAPNFYMESVCGIDWSHISIRIISGIFHDMFPEENYFSFGKPCSQLIVIITVLYSVICWHVILMTINIFNIFMETNDGKYAKGLVLSMYSFISVHITEKPPIYKAKLLIQHMEKHFNMIFKSLSIFFSYSSWKRGVTSFESCGISDLNHLV